MSQWPMSPLGDVITHRKQFATIYDDHSYKRCRIQLSARGIVLRDIVLGADIKTKKQQVCKVGEFLVAEIDAKVGGYGIVPDSLEGAIVSSHYFLFEIDEQTLNRQFLGWYIKTPQFLEQITAKGSTNYAAIRPKNVLEYTIPLLPLDEQGRIVALLDDVAQRITARQKAAESVQGEIGAMLRNAFARIIADAPRRRMGQIAPIVRRLVEIQPGETYHELGVRSFGRGLFDKPILASDDLTWQKLFEIKADDIVFSNIKAWEGAFAVARPRHNGMVGSHRYLTCVVDNRTATPDFLWYFLQSPPGLEQVQAASPGSADRNRTLGQKSLEAILVPVPSLDAQQWFDALQAKAASAAVAQHNASKELDHLLPAMLGRAFGV